VKEDKMNETSAADSANSANVTETVVYSDLPAGCSAVIQQNDKEVTVLIRREGQIDWVVWAGPKVR
jgi:hypothetical protein